MFRLCLPLYICTLHYYVHTSVCPYIPDPVRLGLIFQIFVSSKIIFFITKMYVMAPHLNRLGETVLMMGSNIHYKGVICKIIPK